MICRLCGQRNAWHRPRDAGGASVSKSDLDGIVGWRRASIQVVGNIRHGNASQSRPGHREGRARHGRWPPAPPLKFAGLGEQLAEGVVSA